ncbi:hypothetical protein BD413DRAFT_146334 [Trametes elegans]|nr:hypothetical protein BD413DRAFT_146334 [Trametes elegans]
MSGSKLAHPPFDKPTADVILRSADATEFRVFSQILVMASPVFEDMVFLARPEPGPAAGVTLAPDQRIPIIPLSEDSATLDTFLRLCYPIEKPDRPRKLEEILPILEAALKYMMAWPISVLLKELLAFAPARPLQVWAIGCQLGLENVARAGAEGALHFRELGTYNNLREFVPVKDFLREARGVSAGDYFRLLEFRRLGGTATASTSFSLTRPASRVGADADSFVSNVTLVPDDFYTSPAYPDVLLLAADGAEFPLHKGLVCLCSPILAARLKVDEPACAMQSSPSALAKGLPILKLAEESRIVDGLFRFCYPGEHAFPENPSTLLAMLEAAERYNMRRIADLLKSQWEVLAVQNPLAVYFLASQNGLREEAQRAARHALRLVLVGEYVPEMENSTSQVYYRLLEYHKRAQEVATRIATEFGWTQQDSPSATTPASNPPLSQKRIRRHKSSAHTADDRCQGGCRGFNGRAWVEERRASYIELMSERPGGDFLPDTALLRSSMACILGEKPWCTYCLGVAVDIVRMGTVLSSKISAELGKIAL